MKKYIMLLGFSLLFCGGQVLNSQPASASNASTDKVSIATYEKNVSDTVPISGKTYLNKLNSGHKFIVYFGYKECVYCRLFSPTLKKFSLKHKVYYVNVDSLFKSGEGMANQVLKKSHVKGTPTTESVNHKKVIRRLSGSQVNLSQLNHLI